MIRLVSSGGRPKRRLSLGAERIAIDFNKACGCVRAYETLLNLLKNYRLLCGKLSALNVHFGLGLTNLGIMLRSIEPRKVEREFGHVTIPIHRTGRHEHVTGTNGDIRFVILLRHPNFGFQLPGCSFNGFQVRPVIQSDLLQFANRGQCA